MIYLSAQPDDLYYAWQVETMIHNFKSVGIDPKKIHIVVGYKGAKISHYFHTLKEVHFDVNFAFYRDIRRLRQYPSSIRPYILSRYFRDNPLLQAKSVFYHDCDIALTRRPELAGLCTDDIWYQSDTNSYLNHDYIVSKGEDVLQKMCEIGGIDPSVLKHNNKNSGGAQTILKNVDWEFWKNVYTMSETLWVEINKLNRQKKRADRSHHPLQIWCADMWALNFNAWKRGYKTFVTPALDFTWATSPRSHWSKNLIYHNAGVTSDKNGMFFKNKFKNKVPFFVNIKGNKDKANFDYLNLIRKMKHKTCLI